MVHWLFQRSFRNIGLEFDDLFHSCFNHSNPGGAPNKLFSFEFFFTKGHLPSLSFNNVLSQLKCFLSLSLTEICGSWVHSQGLTNVPQTCVSGVTPTQFHWRASAKTNSILRSGQAIRCKSCFQMQAFAIALLSASNVLGNLEKFNKNIGFHSPFFDEPAVKFFCARKLPIAEQTNDSFPSIRSL